MKSLRTLEQALTPTKGEPRAEILSQTKKESPTGLFFSLKSSNKEKVFTDPL